MLAVATAVIFAVAFVINATGTVTEAAVSAR
jgi:hypothetical protein